MTVQNKVDPADAKRLVRHLTARYRPCTLRVRGLQVWRYDYGPWSAVEEIPFPTAARD